jgi:hypothetical protein
MTGEGSVCEIPLQRTRLVALVDTEDYERLCQFPWIAIRKNLRKRTRVYV